MTRNLDTRVEITCPIIDQNIQQELLETFDKCWKDNVKARVLCIDQENAYRRNKKSPVRSQFALYDYYLEKLQND